MKHIDIIVHDLLNVHVDNVQQCPDKSRTWVCKKQGQDYQAWYECRL